MKTLLLFISFSLVTFLSFAQGEPSKQKQDRKGSLFLYWGYNRSYYSTTNLHFNGKNYDFTLYNLKAHDRPSKVGMVYINPTTFTIPQYNYRLGYFITNRIAISGGIDHMKYVVDENQPTRISGVIRPEASATYAGTYLNDTITLKRDLLLFEHTDGFNFVSIDFEYLQPIKSIWKNRIAFSWNVGIGGVWAVARTDVRVMGDGINNDFHVAGYALGLKTGPRIEYKKRIFLSGEVKGGYASLPSVLIKNEAPEIGDHNFYFLEYYVVLGVNFRMNRLFSFLKK